MPSAEEKNQQRRREDARRDVLAFLAIRAPLAFRVGAIRDRVNRDSGTNYTEDEIVASLEFRRGTNPPEVEQLRDPAGTNHTYRATSVGQLNYERGEY